MSEEVQNETPASPAVAAPGNWQANELAAAVVAGINAAQGPRKIGIGRYLRERSVHRGKPFLARKCYQNGYPLEESQLSVDAIEMLNVLKPGVYCEGMFRVVQAQDGNTYNGIDIQYTNKSPDDRSRIRDRFRSLEHILAAMLKEQAARDTVAAS